MFGLPARGGSTLARTDTGHPESAYRSVLIAGTNGKGSVAAMLHSMLESSGIEAGMFTSPHLVRPNERIRVGDADISDDDLKRLLTLMRTRIEAGVEDGGLEFHPSFFEVVTATALETFRERGVRAALLEVGLGGRLDATNAVDGDLSVIVSIDLDHTKTLGPTLELIAGEKAGIIKPGKPVISGVERPRAVSVLQQVCRERGSPLIDARAVARLAAEDRGSFTLETDRARYPGLRLSLEGRHQIDNARVALATFEPLAERLGFEPDPEAVREGLASVRWTGRLQWLPETAQRPRMLFDGAHNPAGTQTLAAYVGGLPDPAPVVLFGAMTGKLLPSMLDVIGPLAHTLVITRPDVNRSADPDEIATIARERTDRVEVVPDPARALERAGEIAGGERFVLVTGSLYLVGEILGLLEERAVPGPVSM